MNILLAKLKPQQLKTSLTVKRWHRVNSKKAPGDVSLCVGMLLSIFVALLLLTQLQIQIYQLLSENVEDALAASNLAAAVVDVEEYGISGEVCIKDFEEAKNRFVKAMNVNLGLEGEGEYSSQNYISSYKIEEFTVYNVYKDHVEQLSFDGEKNLSIKNIDTDKATSSDGKRVINTSIYSRISFPVDGPFGVKIHAVKSNLVDIVSETEEKAETQTEGSF